MAPRYRFIADAAEEIGKSTDTVYRHLRATERSGEIGRRRVGRRTAVDVEALAAYDAAQPAPGRPRKSPTTTEEKNR